MLCGCGRLNGGLANRRAGSTADGAGSRPSPSGSRSAAGKRGPQSPAAAVDAFRHCLSEATTKSRPAVLLASLPELSARTPKAQQVLTQADELPHPLGLQAVPAMRRRASASLRTAMQLAPARPDARPPAARLARATRKGAAALRAVRRPDRRFYGVCWSLRAHGARPRGLTNKCFSADSGGQVHCACPCSHRPSPASSSTSTA